MQPPLLLLATTGRCCRWCLRGRIGSARRIHGRIIVSALGPCLATAVDVAADPTVEHHVRVPRCVRGALQISDGLRCAEDGMDTVQITVQITVQTVQISDGLRCAKDGMDTVWCRNGGRCGLARPCSPEGGGLQSMKPWRRSRGCEPSQLRVADMWRCEVTSGPCCTAVAGLQARM